MELLINHHARNQKRTERFRLVLFQLCYISIDADPFSLSISICCLSTRDCFVPRNDEFTVKMRIFSLSKCHSGRRKNRHRDCCRVERYGLEHPASTYEVYGAWHTHCVMLKTASCCIGLTTIMDTHKLNCYLQLPETPGTAGLSPGII